MSFVLVPETETAARSGRNFAGAVGGRSPRKSAKIVIGATLVLAPAVWVARGGGGRGVSAGVGGELGRGRGFAALRSTPRPAQATWAERW